MNVGRPGTEHGGVEHLSQNQKRIKLLDAAFRIGEIARADLERSRGR
jgi:hypothetical protein